MVVDNGGAFHTYHIYGSSAHSICSQQRFTIWNVPTKTFSSHGHRLLSTTRRGSALPSGHPASDIGQYSYRHTYHRHTANYKCLEWTNGRKCVCIAHKYTLYIAYGHHFIYRLNITFGAVVAATRQNTHSATTWGALVAARKFIFPHRHIEKEEGREERTTFVNTVCARLVNLVLD